VIIVENRGPAMIESYRGECFEESTILSKIKPPPNNLPGATNGEI
jgi:hypothetical protein